MLSVCIRTPALLCGLVVLGALAGCRTWQPAEMSPETLIAQERPSSVRVTVTGGATVTLRHPRIVNDSIVSSNPPATTVPFAMPRVGVESGDVRSLEVARFNAPRTIALGAMIVGGSIAWARVASGNRGGSLPREPGPPKGPELEFSGVVRWLLGALR